MENQDIELHFRKNGVRAAKWEEVADSKSHGYGSQIASSKED